MRDRRVLVLICLFAAKIHEKEHCLVAFANGMVTLAQDALVWHSRVGVLHEASRSRRSGFIFRTVDPILRHGCFATAWKD